MLTNVQQIEILISFGYIWLNKKAIVKPVARHLLSYDTTTNKIVNIFRVDEDDKVLVYNSAILDVQSYETFVGSLMDYEKHTRFNLGHGEPYNIKISNAMGH